MVRPAERIDSIRIHHVTGLGTSGGSEGGGGKAPVSQALDSILEMAVQMPAMKKLGDQIGLSLDEGLLEARRRSNDESDGGKSDG